MTNHVGFRRTHNCGELRTKHVGEVVTLAGWVASLRDAGGLRFLLLRDREGMTQVLLDKAAAPEPFAASEPLRVEFVVAVRGQVRRREGEFVNKEMPTGEIEVVADELVILNTCEPLPFPISFAEKKGAGEASEEVRLANRYLDLRRPPMLANLRLRHAVCQAMREVLNERGYLEVETPILGKSTPEGARDYLVPARKYPGTFFALPQSPQQYKQMLQTAGVEKYYQIARCFRDEDLRGDRQPEFTQLDIEASFVDEEDVMELMEHVVVRAAKAATGVELTPPFPRMPYDEAMRRYGKDAPDVRFGMELVDVTEQARGCGFKVFAQAAESGGAVRAIVAKGAAGKYKRKQVEDWEKLLKSQYPKVKGLAWFAMQEGQPAGGIAKFMQGEAGAPFIEALGLAEGDVAFFLADHVDVVCDGLGTLRKWLGEDLGLIDPQELAFLWIVDFPMFEYSEEEDRWVARHHPFTQPKPEHLSLLRSDPGKVKARAYDLVLNGTEAAGGSIRIHRREMQREVFEALGIDEDEAQARFGHLLRALGMGTPPHGGIALGLDRFVMLLAREQTIRDVIAFPKTLQAKDVLMGAPDVVDQGQLEELHIAIQNTGDK